MTQAETIENLHINLGVSLPAAKLYFATLTLGTGTLTELAREAEISRITAPKPIKELLILGILRKQVVGKRLKYYPLNPADLSEVVEKKKQNLVDLAKVLVQQISASEQDMQIRWLSGISGIHTAFREFFSRGKGDFVHFENAETYSYVGKDFAESLIDLLVSKNRKNRVVVISGPQMDPWYRAQIEKDYKQLRQTIVVSEKEYPFHANIAACENLIMIFEYREKPFVLLIDNIFVAESVRAIHQMVWDRYRGE